MRFGGESQWCLARDAAATVDAGYKVGSKVLRQVLTCEALDAGRNRTIPIRMAAMTEPITDESPLHVARRFIDCINAGDGAGLCGLTTDDHRFIDSLGNLISGRQTIEAAWAGYF